MDMTHKVSGLTHRHPIAQSACGIYVNIAARLLAGTDKTAAVQEGVSASVGWYRRHEKFEEALPVWEPLLDTVSPGREAGERDREQRVCSRYADRVALVSPDYGQLS